MTDKATSEALRLAAWLNEGTWHQMRLGDVEAAGRELRRQHARIAELEAQLKAVGAAPAGPWSLGEMTGNWRDIDLPDHGGIMRIVWKMEDDEGRNEKLEAQAHAVVAALNAASPTPPAEQPEDEGISREQWIDQAVRVYLIAGDTEDQALECAAYLWGELDMDDLADPYDAAMSDIEGRGPVPQAAPKAAPAGWKLVPVEPTEAMVSAGYDAYGVHACYAAMLAASTTPPAEQPDITKLTERGAVAWAGVDAQALRDGMYQPATTTEAVTPKGDATTGAALGVEQAAPKAAPGEPVKQTIREQIAAEVATQPAAQVEFLARWLCERDRINPDQVLDDNPVRLAWHREDLTSARLLKKLAELAPQQEAQEPVATKTKRVRSLLDYEPKTGAFFWKSTFGRAKAGTEAGYIHTDKRGGQYRCIKLDGQIHQANRLVFLHCFGIDPGEFEVDHIDGDKLNNAIANLRLVTHKQNSENRKLGENNTSGYMGVCWIEQHQVWRAMITHNNRRIFIGHFKTAEMAHEAYEAKRAELFTHDEGRHLTQPAPECHHRPPCAECAALAAQGGQ